MVFKKRRPAKVLFTAEERRQRQHKDKSFIDRVLTKGVRTRGKVEGFFIRRERIQERRKKQLDFILKGRKAGQKKAVKRKKKPRRIEELLDLR